MIIFALLGLAVFLGIVAVWAYMVISRRELKQSYFEKKYPDKEEYVMFLRIFSGATIVFILGFTMPVLLTYPVVFFIVYKLYMYLHEPLVLTQEPEEEPKA